jgi:2-dehydropantoate 2-reductase
MRDLFMKKIGIIGAGSIGLLFASHLSKAFSVTVFTRTREQASEITKNGGIFLIENKQQLLIPVHALQVDEWVGNEDLTVVAVKQYQLDIVIEKINKINNCKKNLLFLQNGMGHLKQLSFVNANNIFVGSVEHGASKDNTITVRHNGGGVINLAVYRGDREYLSQIATKFPSEFPVTIQENYFEMLVNKLIVNAVINPLTAILKVKNGELISNPFYFMTLESFFGEISCVLNLKNPQVYLQKIITVCENTADNRSSMLKDIEMGRKTEVEAILGFLIEEAEKQEKNTPLITTFNNLVKGKEAEKGEEC